MTRRVVVIGADATGMSAASQAFRLAGRQALEWWPSSGASTFLLGVWHPVLGGRRR